MTRDREEVELAESEEARGTDVLGVGEGGGPAGAGAAPAVASSGGNGTEASVSPGEAPAERAASDAAAEGSEAGELADAGTDDDAEDEDYDDDLEDARDEVLDFLDGLLEAMGVDGEADADIIDDGVDAWIEGDDLGLLIGRRGQVLDALQELLRIAVQRRLMERVRISLDVAGYRQRRRVALEQRAEEMAQLALEDGEVKLEAMSAFERKIVHETVARIEGVRSFSEGEEPRRCVVIEAED
jgi:spoIIIJ-associated protein